MTAAALEKLRIEQVQDYSTACNLLGQEELTLDHYKALLKNDRKAVREFGHHMLETMVTAINLNEDGSEYDADYNDTNVGKYYNWWRMYDREGDAPGSGFALDGVNYGHGYADLGARLQCRSRSRAEHLAKIALEPYRMWMKG